MERKLKDALKDLEEVLAEKDRVSESVAVRAGIAKCFEVSLEYAWKEMKKKATEEGLEVFSPKEAVKASAGLGLIEDPEAWIDFINLRNLSVHDYLGVEDARYLKAAAEFLREAKAFLKKLGAK